MIRKNLYEHKQPYPPPRRATDRLPFQPTNLPTYFLFFISYNLPTYLLPIILQIAYYLLHNLVMIWNEHVK